MLIEFQIPKFFTKSIIQIIKQKLLDHLQGNQEADFRYASFFQSN